MADINLKLNAKQFEFFNAEEQQVALTSGLGGGKSYVLYATFIFKHVLKYRGGIHCIVALSYSQLKDVSLPYVEYFLDLCKVKYYLNRSEMKIYLKDSKKTQIIFRSQDTADRVRSLEFSTLALEECAYMNPTSFTTFLSRLRNKIGERKLLAVSTPKGFNFFYSFFAEEKRENRKIIYASTLDNKHLPPEYVEMLKESLDPELLKQELEGRFLNLNFGVTYYAFSRNIHIEKRPPNNFFNQFYVGLDFNVNPLCGVLMGVRGNKLYALEELYLKHSNTYQAADYIKLHWGNLDLVVIPDATGKNRSSNSTRTDHQILSDANLEVARVRNPLRKDRFNCVNGLFAHKRIVVSENCKNLIKDLEIFSDGENNDTAGHITDALGYVAWYNFPLRKIEHSKHIDL